MYKIPPGGRGSISSSRSKVHRTQVPGPNATYMFWPQRVGGAK